jgi:hypothetical protein
MELLPAHQPLPEDDTDEEISDEQIRELLNEAAIRMRAKAAGKPTVAPDVPFKLPKLKPGHLADTYEKTDGSITRLDHSKLVDKKQQALANGIKKIDDPLAIKRQKMEVRPIFPNFRITWVWQWTGWPLPWCTVLLHQFLWVGSYTASV